MTRSGKLMTRSGKFAAGTAIAALLSLGAAPALAQSGAAAEQGATGPAPTQQDAAAYPDTLLEAFATAAVEVSEVRADYARRLAEAEDRGEAEALVSEAQERMIAAVEAEEDITVEQYSAIATSAETDPELAERLALLIEERTGAPGEG